jgi:hypothetical protein
VTGRIVLYLNVFGGSVSTSQLLQFQNFCVVMAGPLGNCNSFQIEASVEIRWGIIMLFFNLVLMIFIYLKSNAKSGERIMFQ